MLDKIYLCYIILIVAQQLQHRKEVKSIMATVTPRKISVNIKLDDGVDSQGNAKYVTISLGKISLTGYNQDKAVALVNLLTPCLDKTHHATEEVKVNTLTA